MRTTFSHILAILPLCLSAMFLALLGFLTFAQLEPGVHAPVGGLLSQGTTTARTSLADSGALTGASEREVEDGRERVPLPEGLRVALKSAINKDSYQIKRNEGHSAVPGSRQAGDWYGAYTLPVSPGDGLQDAGPSSGKRVYRGGSCRYMARLARSTGRDRHAPAFRGYDLGIRPAREITR